jgi:CRISPR/Cas system CSM-associated protein Csm2 small subunit
MKKTTLLTTGLLLAFATPVLAERPTAPRLFSGKAIVYARVNDSRELKDKMAETSTGKMTEDKDIKPIIDSFYTSFTQLVQGMQKEVGVNFDELLSIPNGEMAMAVIPTKTNPAICFLIEAGSEMPAVELIIERLDQRILERGNLKRVTKSIGKIEVVRYESGNASRQFGYFIDSGVLVASTTADYIETLAQIWQGSGIDHTPLADNRNFTDILSRCVGTAGERPQISFYVDPIAIARESLKQSPSSFIALTAMKTLGLDGFKAMGGSLILGTKEFDSIAHFHMLMETNRQGVLRALRPKSGSTEPEAWINDTVVSYNTMNWDFQKTLKAVQEIVDTFGGENAFESNVIANASRETGIDIRKDFLEQLDDRITLTQVVLPSKKINSQSNLFGIHMKKSDRIKSEILPKLFEKAKLRESRWTSKQIGDTTVYFLDININSSTVRPPRPAFAMVGNDLLISDALESIEQAIATFEDGDSLLSDSIEYKLIRDKIKAQLKEKEYSIMSYQRPEEQLRLFYDLAKDPENVKRLEDMSQNNPFFGALFSALKGRNLPPFEQLSKYMVPAGAFMTEEENGLHYTTFSLKRD